jgi:hypothetical protein
MKKAAVKWLVAASGLILTPLAQADAAPLKPDELRRCASQVQQLRADSPRLSEQSLEIDRERQQINQQTAALKAEDERLKPDDLKAGLDLHQRRQRNQAQAAALNARLGRLRREIQALNLLKTDYDRNCSNRPYRRADLDTLPENARNAMRAGMSDVQVPYIEAAP